MDRFVQAIIVKWKKSIAPVTIMEVTIQLTMQRLLALWTPIANLYTIVDVQHQAPFFFA
jgi:hypothetical protein